MSGLNDYLQIRKPTQKEIDAVDDRRRFWFVKRRTMWKPIYAPAGKQGIAYMLVTRLGMILLFVLLMISVIGLPLFVILFGIMWVVDVSVKARKTFPEVERIRLNQYHDDTGKSLMVNKTIEDAYDRLSKDKKNRREER